MINFQFACPICQTTLQRERESTFICPQDGRIYTETNGIWHFLPPERSQFYAQFVQEYETIRLAEGRQSGDAAYYRALPYQDLSGKMTTMWAIRAQTFALLLKKVIHPLAKKRKRPLHILDLGAGNGWLSYQLAKQGHHLAAIDLTINSYDGLGVHPMYDTQFLPIQAEFTQLPLTDKQADITLFNASFHYAERYEEVLAEAWRVTQADGVVVVADTPVYTNPENGRIMVQEREKAFQAQYNFPSNALASENFLWPDKIKDLAQSSHKTVTLHSPIPRWRQLVRRSKTKLRQQREAAHFPLLLFTAVTTGAN